MRPTTSGVAWKPVSDQVNEVNQALNLVGSDVEESSTAYEFISKVFMDLRSFQSKTPSRLQQPYYSKALLSKESPKRAVTPTGRRKHSLVNGCKTNNVDGDSLCASEISTSSHQTYLDVSPRLPTLFNFRPGKMYHCPASERSVCRTDMPGFMSIVEPPSSDSFVEHAIRILESRKRLQSSDESNTNGSATPQGVDADSNGTKRRRTNQVPNSRLPDISTVGSDATDCFSYTSLYQLTKDKSNQITCEETVNHVSRSVQTQNMATNCTGSSITSPTLGNKDDAAALRRRIPYMSPAELEAHLLSSNALKATQSKPEIFEIDDIDEDFDCTLLLNRKRMTARRQLTQNTDFPQVSPEPLNDNLKISADIVGNISATTIDLDQPIVPSSTNSLAKFISDLENHSFNSPHNSSFDLPPSKSKNDTPKLSDKFAHSQSDLDSRVQRIRSLLSRVSPERKLSDTQSKSDTPKSLFSTVIVSSSAAPSSVANSVTTNPCVPVITTSGFVTPASSTSSSMPSLTKPLSSPGLFNISTTSAVSLTLSTTISDVPAISSTISKTTASIVSTTSSSSMTAAGTLNSSVITPVVASTSSAMPSSLTTTNTMPAFSFGLPKSTTATSTFAGFNHAAPIASSTNGSITTGLISTSTITPPSAVLSTVPSTVFLFPTKTTAIMSSSTTKTSDSLAPSPANNLFNFNASTIKPKPDTNVSIFGSVTSITSSTNAPQFAFVSSPSTPNVTSITPTTTICATSTNLFASPISSSNAFQSPFSGFSSGAPPATTVANKTGTIQTSESLTSVTSSVPPFGSFLSTAPLFSTPVSIGQSSTAAATTTSLFSFSSTVTSVSTESAPTFTGFNFADIKAPKVPIITTTPGFSQNSSTTTNIFSGPISSTTSNLFGTPTVVATASTTPTSSLFGSGFQNSSKLFGSQLTSATTTSFPFVGQAAVTTVSNLFGTTTSSQTIPASTGNLFTLGVKPASTASVPSKPTLSFGSNPTPALTFSSTSSTTTTAPATTNLFTFGAASTGLTSSATAPAQLFQFGSTNAFPSTQTTTITPSFNLGSSAPVFSFGQTTQPQTQTTQPSLNAPVFGAPITTTATAPAGGFNFSQSVPAFGSASNANASFGGFNFGINQPTASTTAIGPSPGAFVFGQTVSNSAGDSAAPNPFTFGSTTTSSSTVPRRRPLSSRRSRRP